VCFLRSAPQDALVPNPPNGALNFRRSLPGLYRSGNLSRLTGRGREQLLELGISRILDLRNRAERDLDPPPFLQWFGQF